jgi:uncharacterized protein (UPF0261 family)
VGPTPGIALVGTLDTKGDEADHFRDALRDAGLDVVVVDVGSPLSAHGAADIPAPEVATAAGVSMAAFAGFGSRAEAVSVMGSGAA